MFRNKIILIVLLFFSIVVLHSPVGATNITIPGYYEIIFSGTTTDFDGVVDFPVEGSSSTYTPAVGDAISIHFGATYFNEEWAPPGESYSTWNHDSTFDIFIITVNDGTNGYVFDGSYATDWNGYNSSFRDDFWVHFVAGVGGILSDGGISFDHETQSGYFSMRTDDFKWNAELTSSIIVSEPEPVPEPGTLLLLSAGLIGLTRIRKRTQG